MEKGLGLGKMGLREVYLKQEPRGPFPLLNTVFIPTVAELEDLVQPIAVLTILFHLSYRLLHQPLLCPQ